MYTNDVLIFKETARVKFFKYFRGALQRYLIENYIMVVLRSPETLHRVVQRTIRVFAVRFLLACSLISRSRLFFYMQKDIAFDAFPKIDYKGLVL
jgi:hypothetical protein